LRRGKALASHCVSPCAQTIGRGQLQNSCEVSSGTPEIVTAFLQESPLRQRGSKIRLQPDSFAKVRRGPIDIVFLQIPTCSIEIRYRKPMVIVVCLNDGRTRLDGCFDVGCALAALPRSFDRICRQVESQQQTGRNLQA
jgi:hypothetical protein